MIYHLEFFHKFDCGWLLSRFICPSFLGKSVYFFFVSLSSLRTFLHTNDKIRFCFDRWIKKQIRFEKHARRLVENRATLVVEQRENAEDNRGRWCALQKI